ncbi:MULTISPECIES: sensor domain-containing protein [Alteromonas]|uniref:sensor domain-containing protein n=2 Tax=Alteromonas TaxID=226 RepID=UPI000EBAB108|nr:MULTISPECIES: GGDEF domain-containing phosphodiesterase [Alteromonas]MCG7649479.1 EAL domain-containing protein [Alteromonas sp. MmMcT2-5]MEC8964629.1 EAL domain-containing protein [Pseudomonadota bacterium]MEC9274898.1 EAL domain-containing protein [Pseudomonadota bacterium]HCG87334.1 GGDEF domain-containing protein [Alteromonas macleodii]|tara:strand:- start:340 stop:2898 length:2559 start_codon:yes stop_codon:yes gene_type:complete
MSFESVLNESEFSTIVLENRSAYEQDLLGFNELLHADYLFLGVKKADKISVLVGLAHDSPISQIEYDLKGSPCETVLLTGACGYKSDICEHFPDDQTLSELNAQGYLGAGLFNEKNQDIGLLVAIFNTPKHDINEWLQVFSLQAKLFSTQLQKDFFAIKTARNLSLIDEISRMSKTGSWEFYPETEKLIWSSETYRIFGLPVGSAINVQKAINSFAPGYTEELTLAFDNLRFHQQPYDIQCKIIDSSGTIRWVRASGKAELYKNGAVKRLFGAFEDITEYKTALTLNEERAMKIQNILNNINDAVFSIDVKGTITHCNDIALKTFGYTRSELIAQSVEILMPEPYASNHAFYMRNYMETGVGKIIGVGRQLPAKRKNGDIFQMELSLSESFDQGERGFIGVIRDISERIEAQDTIYNLAYTDSVTRLRNQQWFHQRFKDLMLRASLKQEYIHILLLDIDNMAQINTRFGFGNGNYAIRKIAEQLLFVIGHDYEIFKYGGDSFVVLSKKTYIKEDLHKFDANLVESALLSPRHFDIVINSVKWSLTASLGSAIFNPQGQSFESIINVIEQAVKRAKRSAPFGLCHISEDGFKEFDRYLDIKSKLEQAIERDELSIVLQPQVTHDGTVSSFEALVRWYSKELGPVSPSEFIPIAEESYAICEIGDIVLRKTLSVISNFVKSGLKTSIAINISARQIVVPDFINSLLSRVNQYGIPPHMLMLELTETALVVDIELVKETMLELARFGFRFSIDDFGTGYSSLAYLKVLPISELKIDKYFVDDIGKDFDGKAAQIVDAIIEMAKALNVTCIAEGVESEEQLKYLIGKGCEKFQGYYFSRPEPEAHWAGINENTKLP